MINFGQDQRKGLELITFPGYMAIAEIFEIVIESFAGCHTGRCSYRYRVRGVVFEKAEVIRWQSEVNVNVEIGCSVFTDCSFNNSIGRSFLFF